jgi:hypothetical protein
MALVGISDQEFVVNGLCPPALVKYSSKYGVAAVVVAAELGVGAAVLAPVAVVAHIQRNTCQ